MTFGHPFFLILETIPSYQIKIDVIKFPGNIKHICLPFHLIIAQVETIDAINDALR